MRAVGLAWEATTTPYDSGPYLVGAKLTRLNADGEGGPVFLQTNMPNDGVALYGESAKWRVRMLTSGGFSPDGVRGLLPTEFARYFRLHALGAGGADVVIAATDTDYAVAGGTLRVLGLADLGVKQASYDDCYVEDHDNQVDIILSGDEAAVRSLVSLEIPAGDGYDPLYNPGGPGTDPTPGVTYTAPGPADIEPIVIAIDDPAQVTLE